MNALIRKLLVIASIACVSSMLIVMTLFIAACGNTARERSAGMHEGAPVPTAAAPGFTPRGSVQNSMGLTAALRSADPGSMPSMHEELWVITKVSASQPAKPGDDFPGSGSLVTLQPRPDGTTPQWGEPDAGKSTVPIPLEHTSVNAGVIGNIAAVDVTQRFSNPFASKIEAVYVFPLPENAGVSEFVMTVGDRTIRGIIRERQEAEKIYAEAKSAGYVASLMTQERPNIFTQKVANIEPGKTIDISIRYFNTMAYSDGWYEFAFPMVVGPRFNPPSTAAAGDGIGAVPRNMPGSSGQRTEVSYLKPSERSGHDISVSLTIDAGVPIEAVQCVSHRVLVNGERPSGGGIARPSTGVRSRATVELAKDDRIPNKDLVVRWRVSGEGDEVRMAAVAQSDPNGPGGHFTMMLVPPADAADLPRMPMELVFVLDCSGSMSGTPITQAKDAVRHALSNMKEADTFQIIRFSDNASAMGSSPVQATSANIRRAKQYLDSLNSEGGTMMIEGIRAALNFPHDPQRLRYVVFLTDGYIGNESDIVTEINRSLGASRIFSFGVGSSVNRYLMDAMARAGRGAVAYLGPRDDGDDVMDAFFSRASRPAMTDVSIDRSSFDFQDIYPGSLPSSLDVAGMHNLTRIPDVYVGRAVVVTGRYSGSLPSSVRVRARIGGSDRTLDIPIRMADASLASGALSKVWARQKISAMSDAALLPGAGDISGMIRDTALTHGLLSAYTAFLAVDSSRITEGSHGTTVNVPVPMPEGVRYDTTVGGERTNPSRD